MDAAAPRASPKKRGRGAMGNDAGGAGVASPFKKKARRAHRCMYVRARGGGR
jgi:hypothetical protein